MDDPPSEQDSRTPLLPPPDADDTSLQNDNIHMFLGTRVMRDLPGNPQTEGAILVTIPYDMVTTDCYLNLQIRTARNAWTTHPIAAPAATPKSRPELLSGINFLLPYLLFIWYISFCW